MKDKSLLYSVMTSGLGPVHICVNDSIYWIVNAYVWDFIIDYVDTVFYDSIENAVTNYTQNKI